MEVIYIMSREEVFFFLQTLPGEFSSPTEKWDEVGVGSNILSR